MDKGYHRLQLVQRDKSVKNAAVCKGGSEQQRSRNIEIMEAI